MQSLDANEALVVYKQDQETQEVTRYVQFGPTLFMPQAHEWFVIILLLLLYSDHLQQVEDHVRGKY